MPSSKDRRRLEPVMHFSWASGEPLCIGPARLCPLALSKAPADARAAGAAVLTGRAVRLWEAELLSVHPAVHNTL